MGLELLARVRRSTVIAGAVVALFTATYVAPRDGLALALGVAWSLVNLWLLERLIVALTGADRALPATRVRAATTLGGLAGLFAAGAVLLATLPPITLLAGFLLPFAVLVLKAASLLLLGSKAWRRFTSDPRRAAGLIVALGLAAWAAAPLLAGAADPHAADPHAASATAHPESGAATVPGGEHAQAHDASDGHGAEAGTHGGGTHAQHGSGQSAGPQKFANVITVLSRAFPDAGWAQFLHHYEVIAFSLLVAALICVVAAIATRRPKMIPGRLQNLVELLVESLYDFIVGILGPRHGPRFVPFLGTLFIYIWVMNLSGLIPFMEAPTSSLNVTFALAIVVFLYVQWIGLRGLGLGGYVDHLLGQPRDLTGWMLAPLMLPIHLLGELAKPISLSCRLFGNIFGEDMLLVAFVSLGITTLGFLPSWAPGLPLQLPFMFLALLTGTLQALVFTVLSTIYLLLMLPHDDHGHEEQAHAPAH